MHSLEGESAQIILKMETKSPIEGNANWQKGLARRKFPESCTNSQLCSHKIHQIMQKYDCKISENSHFQVCHFAMPLLSGAVENFNIGAQPHSLPYAKASKVHIKIIHYVLVF